MHPSRQHNPLCSQSHLCFFPQVSAAALVSTALHSCIFLCAMLTLRDSITGGHGGYGGYGALLSVTRVGRILPVLAAYTVHGVVVLLHALVLALSSLALYKYAPQMQSQGTQEGQFASFRGSPSLQVFLCACIFVPVCVRVYVCVYLYMCPYNMDVCICMYMYALCMYVYMCAYIYTHIYIFVYILVSSIDICIYIYV